MTTVAIESIACAHTHMASNNLKTETFGNALRESGRAIDYDHILVVLNSLQCLREAALYNQKKAFCVAELFCSMCGINEQELAVVIDELTDPRGDHWIDMDIRLVRSVFPRFERVLGKWKSADVSFVVFDIFSD